MISAERETLLAALETQHRLASQSAKDVLVDHAAILAFYRAQIAEALHIAVERLRNGVAKASLNNAHCESLMKETTSYLDWLQWTLWDLPSIAVCVRPDPERFRENLAGCSLVYFACRILDDLLDRHFLYRSRRETLLAHLASTPEGHAGAEGLTVILAVLVYFEGLSQLEQPLKTVLESMKRVLTGILMEHSRPECWTPEFYERLIRLKNVDYWHILYAALDPEHSSPLYPFLSDYYAVAQKVNDLQDFARDSAQSRPNFLSIYGRSSESAKDEAELLLGSDLLDLGTQAAKLNEPEHSIALSKLAETYEEARRLGYFQRDASAPDEKRTPPLAITWQSHWEDVLTRFGTEVVECTNCPVCQSAMSKSFFEKQGFQYVTCSDCMHTYVNPRLRAEVTTQIRRELADLPFCVRITEKVHGDYLCRFLRQRAPGPRMLEVRFQSGPFPRTARGSGFQVYGFGGGAWLRPLFGERLAQSDGDAEPIPWGAFDLIVALNTLEQIPEPRLFLSRLRQALSPEGLVFLSVSDRTSIQFRTFGKHWDAVQPIARNHLFSEESLLRLLGECGFELVSPVKFPPLPQQVQTRWMRLFRRLGGDEGGDLAVLARAVKTPDPENHD